MLSLIYPEAQRSLSGPCPPGHHVCPGTGQCVPIGSGDGYGPRSLGVITSEVTRSLGSEWGVITSEVTRSLGQPEKTAAWKWMVALTSLAGAGALAYHGYRRHNSTAAAIGWGILGLIFPVNIIATGVAVGQGFSKRRKR